MPGAMDEIITQAGFFNLIADRLVDLISGYGLSASNRFFHELRAGIASIAHRVKNFLHAVGWRLAHEPRPGDVVINGMGFIFLRPNVEQDKITFADWSGVRAAGPIMRIAAIFIYRHYWCVRAHQIFP